VLLVPAQATDQHLTILGELAQMFSEREVREAMLKASDSEALRRVVENWQP
jgi:PTS system nitrogen regulatory IIA component